MILKHDILVKLNNHDYLLYVELLLEKINEEYFIKFACNGGKWHIKKVDLENVKYINNTSIKLIQKGESEYNKRIQSYLNKKYKNLITFTKHAIKDLTEKDLNKIKNYYRKTSLGIPKPMLPVSYDKVSTDIYENEFYWSPAIPGNRCLIYLKNNDINIYIPNIRNSKKIIEQIHKSKNLINYLKENPSYIFDTIVKVTKENNQYSIKIFIVDIINKDICEDRMILLSELKNTLEDEQTEVIVSQKVSSWYRIEKRLSQAKKAGYLGIILRGANSLYESGKRLSSTMIKIFI